MPPPPSASVAGAKALLRRSITAFFYLWYGVPEHDGRFLHWDHFTLPHWTEAVNRQHEAVINKHRRPDLGDIHAPFFPARGLYSSRDPATLRAQFCEMSDAGMGIAAVSWWGQAARAAAADSQGVSTDGLIPAVLAAAEVAAADPARPCPVRVAFHLEPYPGRTAASVREDLAYIHANYGASPAFAPVYYVYDSYHISAADWASVLSPEGAATVRGTALDGVFIGLWLERHHGQDLVASGFDGFYTYFASTSFSYGSTLSAWPDMAAFARDHGKLFVPSVGPGYDDEKIRPWNAHNTRGREGTGYLDRMFEAARVVGPDAVSVTSFNEWGEGTQVEPARAGVRCEAAWAGNATHLAVAPYAYQEYAGGDPLVFLMRIRYWKERLWSGDEEGGEGAVQGEEL